MYVDGINDIIKRVLEECAALPYEREHLTHMPKFDIQFTTKSDQLFLDVLLMK